MKITVIVPCYNAHRTLQKTVKSILASGLIDYEILLVDDGSQDGTFKACEQLSHTFQNIRVIHQSNSGVSSARNFGLKEAQGEYIWFFDSDDSVDPESMIRVEQIVTVLHPDMLIFGMSFDYYAGNRMYQRLELYYDQECNLAYDEVDEIFSELYRNNMLTPCWNKLIRRDLLTKHNVLFQTNMFVMEDFLFSLEAINKCNSVYILPQAIYRYNQGNTIRDNHVAQRVNRVKDLPEYLRNFEPLLSSHPDILTKLFFMLLRQKLSVQLPQEMKETAKTVCNSKYAVGKYYEYSSKSDRVLLRKLQNGEFHNLYSTYKKARIRSIIVKSIKRTHIYAMIKGTVTKKVRW